MVQVKKFGSEGGGVLWCHPGGTNCVVKVKKVLTPEGADGERYFNHPAADAAHYDPDLDALTQQMNSLVDAAQQRGLAGGRKAPGLQVGFLRTPNGYLPVWKRDVADNERLEDLVDVSTLTPLGSMSDEAVSAHLRLASQTAAGDWYVYKKTTTEYTCESGNGNCYVTVASADGFRTVTDSIYFPKVDEGSPVYDPELATLADELNAALNATQKTALQRTGTSPTEREIGLAFEEDGLTVVWKVVRRS
ncbi:hypothetical protein MWN34_09205 [Ancylobacter sp. 6x-1]|uniref:Uncharacterized protein n=1 Tax=Ancylobacter crimeensis TaxID=2579147 RepID=A0ABT0DB38_9HYPH|nr:hypothetical protein [Ancylobacter crimeensis]MCK0197089.1 hypothetical protein [Ancylobacter crimeensis]